MIAYVSALAYDIIFDPKRRPPNVPSHKIFPKRRSAFGLHHCKANPGSSSLPRARDGCDYSRLLQRTRQQSSCRLFVIPWFWHNRSRACCTYNQKALVRSFQFLYRTSRLNPLYSRFYCYPTAFSQRSQNFTSSRNRSKGSFSLAQSLGCRIVWIAVRVDGGYVAGLSLQFCARLLTSRGMLIPKII